ncbi:hypothetical protein Hanom_Chr08g00692601 [Helianthus anomalus]
MKFPAAKLINTDTTKTGHSRTLPGIGVGGCDRRWYQSYATSLSPLGVLPIPKPLTNFVRKLSFYMLSCEHKNLNVFILIFMTFNKF